MKLNKCPFCGGKPIYGAFPDSKHKVKCLSCHAEIVQDRKDKVIGMWNYRYMPYDDANQPDIKKMLSAYQLLKLIRDIVYEFESLEPIDDEIWNEVDKLYE